MSRTLGPVDVVAPAVAQGGITMAPSSLTRRTFATVLAMVKPWGRTPGVERR